MDTVGYVNEWQLPAPHMPRFQPFYIEKSQILPSTIKRMRSAANLPPLTHYIQIGARTDACPVFPEDK
jgi:hypothetical protein